MPTKRTIKVNGKTYFWVQDYGKKSVAKSDAKYFRNMMGANATVKTTKRKGKKPYYTLYQRRK
jgi:hypothetical protein